MWKYLVNRLLQIVITLFVFFALTYFLLDAQPGDITLQYVMNLKFTPEMRESLQKRLGLDRPVYERFFKWMGNTLKGNWVIISIKASSDGNYFGAGTTYNILVSDSCNYSICGRVLVRKGAGMGAWHRPGVFSHGGGGGFIYRIYPLAGADDDLFVWFYPEVGADWQVPDSKIVAACSGERKLYL